MDAKEKPPRDWMNIVEAAERMGFSPTTVSTLIQTRKLGCRKVGPSGGRYQITEKHIQAYLDSCEIPVKVVGPVPVKPAKGRVYGRAGTIERLDGTPPKYYP